MSYPFPIAIFPFHLINNFYLIVIHESHFILSSLYQYLLSSQDSFSQIYVETVRTLYSTALSCITAKNKANSFYPPWLSSVVLNNSDGTFKDVDCVTYFENKKVRYIWVEEKQEFVKLTGLDVNVDCSFFYKQKGLSSSEQEKR